MTAYINVCELYGIRSPICSRDLIVAALMPDARADAHVRATGRRRARRRRQRRDILRRRRAWRARVVDTYQRESSVLQPSYKLLKSDQTVDMDGRATGGSRARCRRQRRVVFRRRRAWRAPLADGY